ncbi:hypothetical protein COP2_002611 [Malus domestica]
MDTKVLKRYVREKKSLEEEADYTSRGRSQLTKEVWLLLCESIARKPFPHGYQGLEEVRPRKKSLEEEADYMSRARSRLTKEVLLPVRRMTCYDTYDGKCKCRIKQYLEDVKAGR